MIEPLSLPTYAVIGCGAALSAVLVPALSFHVAASAWSAMLFWPYVAFVGMLFRRIGHYRIGSAIEATALTYGQGLGLLFALFPLTALSRPFADRLLASMDSALGFDWIAYARLVEPLIGGLTLAYKSFAWQPLLIVPLLAATNRRSRLWQFVGAAAIALLLSCIVYPFAPAEGASRYYHIGFYAMAADPAHFGTIISLIKSGHRTISSNLFTGFISMPSYHAASAVLFTWAAWPMRYCRWPVAALNILMVAAAPILGAHYLVDLLAGAGVGVAAIYLSRELTRLTLLMAARHLHGRAVPIRNIHAR